MNLWIDGTLQSDLDGLDNDTRRVADVQLGAVIGIDTGTRGTYYFDHFESRQQTYIGGLAGGQVRSRQPSWFSQGASHMKGMARVLGSALTAAWQWVLNLLDMAPHTEKEASSVALVSVPPAGFVFRSYYYAGSQRVAMRETTASGSQVYFLLSDHLGSASKTVSLAAPGVVVSENRYKPWGGSRYTSGTAPTDYLYTGKRLEETGLTYFGARWFDSSLGRWAQPDTIIPLESQGVQAWDRFAYANNSPVRYNDPSGHCISDPLSFMACAMVAGAIVGGAANAYSQYQETGHVDIGQVAESALGGAVIVGGAALIASAAFVGIGALTAAGAAACADGDCGNEAKGVAQTVGSGLSNTNLRFTQTTASPYFSEQGDFAGQTIGSLADGLRNGTVNSANVSVNYIDRGGYRLIENTRSSLALLRADIPIEKWNLVNMTGNRTIEAKITERLLNNGLSEAGSDIIRITSRGKYLSSLK